MVRTFEFEKEEKKCDSCGSPKAKLGYHKCSPHDSSDWGNNGYTKEENEIQSIIVDFLFENPEAMETKDIGFIKRVLSTRIGTLIRNLIQKERAKYSTSTGGMVSLGWHKERIVEARTETLKEVIDLAEQYRDFYNPIGDSFNQGRRKACDDFVTKLKEKQ